MSGRTRLATKKSLMSNTKGAALCTEPNVSANTSYITIISEENDTCNKDTQDNINVRLRDRLAKKEGELEAKEAEISYLNTELKRLKMTLECRDSLIAKLENTIDLVSRPTLTLLRDADTQTEKEVFTPENLAVNACKEAAVAAMHSTGIAVHFPEMSATFGSIVDEEEPPEFTTTQDGTDGESPTADTRKCKNGRKRKKNKKKKKLEKPIVNQELSQRLLETSVVSVETVNSDKCVASSMPKILMLADSQGRHMAKKLHKTFASQYAVQIIFKPNAELYNVTIDVRNLTKDFSESDYLIILAGTNDVLKGKKIQVG